MKSTVFNVVANVVLFLGMLIATICFGANLDMSKPRIEVSLPNPSSASDWNYLNPINAGTATLRFIVPLPKDDYKTDGEIMDLLSRGEAKLWINGNKAEFRLGGRGDSQAGQLRDYEFYFNIYPGAPGTKNVKIRVGEWSAETSFDYRPLSAVFIVGPPDDQEGLFAPKIDPVRWDGYYLVPSSVRVLINGLPVDPKCSPEGPDAFHLSGSIETAPSPGKNILEVDAVDGSGNTRIARTEFNFYPVNKVALNDVFFLREGRSGSNRGPFYKLTIQGKSVAETTAEKYTGSSVRISRGYYFDRLKAVKPGKSTVAVWETNWRNERQHKVFEIQVEVIGK